MDGLAPLPAPPQPGGDIVAAMRAQNALANDMLVNQMQSIKNKYLPAQLSAQQAYRNALTQASQIANQYAPQREQLAINQLQSQLESAPIQRELTQQKLNQLNLNMQRQKETPLFDQPGYVGKVGALQLAIKSGASPEVIKRLRDSLDSEVASRNALTEIRSTGGFRGMGAGQREMLSLKNQIHEEHPDWDSGKVQMAANAYLGGTNQLASGEQLPEPSSYAKTIVGQIRKRTSTADLQNRAAKLDIANQQLQKIPIKEIMKYAGPKGRALYAKEMALMNTNPQAVSPEFRTYKAYRDTNATLLMDELRNALGTSVQPDYVWSTIGKIMRPETNFWNDSAQVEADIKQLQDWGSGTARSYGRKASFGATAQLGNEASKQATSGKKVIKRLRYNKSTGEFEEIK